MRGSQFCRVVVLLASLTPVAGARAAGCVQADISHAAAAVQDARAVLMELPIERKADAGTALSGSAQAAITAMKARLADFVLAYMRCQPQDVDANGITVDLSRLGWAQALEPGRVYRNGEMPPLALHAGWTLSFNTRTPAQGLIGIAATFGIPCGSDTQLMLFEHRTDGWTEIMRVAAKPYRDVAQAYGAFDYLVSPSDAKDGWYLVEKHLPAACASFVSGISYAALRASGNPLKPKVLFAGHGALYSGNEDYGRLAVDSDGFEIRFHDSEDASLREVVRRYTVTGDIVHPVGQEPP